MVMRAKSCLSFYALALHAMCFATVGCCFVVVSPAVGRELIVTPDDDLSRAFATAKAGDVFILANGIWKDQQLEIAAEGTLDAPILVIAETSGKVVFTGNSQLKLSGRYITVRGLHFRNATSLSEVVQFRTSSRALAHNCRMTDCAVTSDAAPMEQVEQKWVSLYGTENRVDHCYFAGKQTAGTLFVVWLGDGNNRHRIDRNYFGHRPPLGRNGGETIRIGDSATSMTASRTVVEENVFDRCDGEAEIISNKSCENVYRRNTFRECSGALTLRHGNRCRVEENFFLGNKARGSGGVRIIGTGHIVVNNYFANLEGDSSRSAISFMNGLVDSPLNGYFQVQDAVVAFNTFIDCKVAMTIGVEASAKQPLAPKNCIVVNNVFVGRRNEVRQEAVPEGWVQASDVKIGSTEALQFQMDRDGVWRPTAASLTIGAAGAQWSEVTRDIDGVERQAPFDVGCDQYGGRTAPPLTAKDVGPDWMPPESR